MKFNVLERIVLSQILPKDGSFLNLKLIRVAKEALSFNEEENKALCFVQKGEVLNWKEGVVEDKEVKLGAVIIDLIVNKLKELDKSASLTENHISLYEKFIGDEDGK